MNLISMRSGLMVLPLFGAGSLLLAHLLTAAAFGRRTDAIIARLEQVSVAEPSTPPVPAIIQSFAQRAVWENPVPNTVWLSQSGKMRANLRNRWRTLTAEQVISIYQPGFARLARMQSAPLSSARLLTATWIARVFWKLAFLVRCPTWRVRRERKRASAN
jgi:regulator of extracellular matrix RemA (YlzA/DUF370 family)